MLNREVDAKLKTAMKLESIFDPAETKVLEREQEERIASTYKSKRKQQRN